MNYYTPLTKIHEAAFKTCLKKVVEIAAKTECNQILLAIPQRGTLQGLIQEIMGIKFINKLLSNKKAKLDSLTFFLQTSHAKSSDFVKGPALAAYSKPEQLKELSKTKNILGIVLFSNAGDEIEEFKRMPDTEELEIIY
ncbi:MAG: hypothetical protein MRK02_05655 [Candidatus Scalindua sp.]|nr:hypothetical protein [Candidatus Scalindua sp.]